MMACDWLLIGALVSYVMVFVILALLVTYKDSSDRR